MGGGFLVEATGFEPTTSWSRTMRATNCATPRFLLFISRRGDGILPIGKASGYALARTHDLMVPNHARYQLRYASAFSLPTRNAYIITNIFLLVNSFYARAESIFKNNPQAFSKRKTYYFSAKYATAECAETFPSPTAFAYW